MADSVREMSTYCPRLVECRSIRADWMPITAWRGQKVEKTVQREETCRAPEASAPWNPGSGGTVFGFPEIPIIPARAM
jgi:hypothetical protein